MKETTILPSVPYSGPSFTVRSDKIAVNGHEAQRDYIDRVGAAAIIPVLQDNGLIRLVEQYRYAIREHMLEIPAGKIDGDEQPLACAKRELFEETGGVSKDWEPLGVYYPSVGYSNEVVHLYLARRVELFRPNPDDGEYLNQHDVTLDTAMELVAQGRIVDAKTIIALLKYREILR